MLFQSRINAFLQLLPYWQKKKEKQEVRAVLEEKRRILTKEQVDEQSALILERLTALPEFQEAKTVLVYYPIRNEVNTRPLLEEYRDKKVMLLPKTKSGHRMELRKYQGRDNLVRGRYGIPEPQGEAYHGKVDLVVVPGVGFDYQLHRLGRGGGYYDRFLANSPRALRVAVAYEFQVKPQIPADRHDKKMDIIVTPSRIIR